MTSVPEHRTRPRWARLSYASFDSGNGVGGWQVRETDGEIDDAERELLLRRVVTSFDAHTSLPDFPAPADLESAPRRLSYLHLGVYGSAYWHAAQAGSDSTGRPGNVYSVAVLDRLPRTPDSFRPIAVWRAPDLPTPFGAAGILEASLGTAGSPGAGALADRDAVLHWATQFVDDCWRPGILVVLLDAVAAALAGGPRVVLVTETADDAAHWLAAVSHLTSAGITRRLSFSVYERAAALPDLWAAGVHVAAIPHSDSPHLQVDPSVVVIRGTEQPRAGDATNPHLTEAGSEVRATPWSQLFMTFAYTPEKLSALLERLDVLGASVGDEGLDPAWPLAMAIVERGDDAADAGDTAVSVLLEASPEALRDVPHLYGLATQAVLASFGGTAEAAWQALQGHRGAQSSVMLELLAGVYLRLAVQDLGWLSAHTGTPVPSPRDMSLGLESRRLVPDLRAALDSRTSGVDAGFDSRITDFRMLDLVGRSGLSADDLRELEDAAFALIARDLDAAFNSPDSANVFTAKVGPIGLWLRTQIMDQLASEPGPLAASKPGASLPPEVFDWLLPDGPSLLLRPSVAGELPQKLSWFERDAAIYLAAQRGASGLHAPIVRGLLDSAAPGTPLEELGWNFKGLYQEADWTPDEALPLERAYPGKLPEDVLVRVLACAVDSPQLDLLVAEVLADVSGVHRSASGELRAADVASFRQKGTELRRALSTTPKVGEMEAGSAAFPFVPIPSTAMSFDPVTIFHLLSERFRDRVNAGVFAPVVLDQILVEMTTDQSNGQNPPTAAFMKQVLRALNDVAVIDAVVRRRIRLIQSRREALSYLQISVAADREMPAPHLVPPEALVIGRIRDARTRDGFLLEASVPAIIERSGYAADVLRDQLAFSLPDSLRSQDAREATELEKFVKSWWRRVTPSERFAGLAALRPSARLREKREH